VPSAFWKHLKPTVRAPAATQVQLVPGGAELLLDWEDGAQTRVLARALRQNCPCAECVEEWSGRRTFEPAAIPEGTTVLDVQQVGNYALSFTFSDAHSTGIFQWATLRELSSPPAP
jgi:DUF971 family protein